MWDGFSATLMYIAGAVMGTMAGWSVGRKYERERIAKAAAAYERDRALAEEAAKAALGGVRQRPPRHE